MRDLNILKGNIKALRKRAQELRVRLEALKEQCRHPKAFVCYSPTRTWCAACDKTLWSSTGDSYWSDQASMSHKETDNISATRSLLKPELDAVNLGIKKLEELCPHPDSLVERSPAPDIGYDDQCGVCGKDWSTILNERRETEQTS